MNDYDDHDEPRRAPGSRIGVLFVGLIIGAIAATVAWAVLAGNPLSDTNEVVYGDITIASVNLEKNTICWSEDPSRRDAGQVCAILALDRSLQPPMPGTRVTIGTVMIQPAGKQAARHAVYVSGRRDATTESEASPQPSD